MSINIRKDSSLAKELSALAEVPAERIEHFAIVIQYDTGVALIHTLCCDAHAREGLARIAATPPDLTDISHDYEGN
jgi:hypothetical protein